MLECLLDHDGWVEYLNGKLENQFLSDKEKEELSDYVNNRKYLPIAQGIVNHTYQFSIPKKKQISKKYTEKKRTVYSFRYDEMCILSYLANRLYRYDNLFSPNLYSFRKHTGVKHAIHTFMNQHRIFKMYGYKIDISNYFNSIDVNLLLPDLKDNIDEDLYQFFETMLREDKTLSNDEVIMEKKGAIAGVPTAAFLANFYLRDMDWYFKEKPVFYFRYSDDILLFAKTEAERQEYIQYINNYLAAKNLKLNPRKIALINPGDRFEFLGFGFDHRTVDLSENSIIKIKKAIHHKAKVLLRWADQKKVSYDKIVKVMNKRFNTKFFGVEENEITWKYWYFPFLTTDHSLKIIDQYMQDTLRYMYTGKHNKANYRACPYETLKKLGYLSLVNEYHKFKENESKEETLKS